MPKPLAIALLLTTAGLGAHADGLIIPAYLTLSDTTNWNVLKEDAALMQSGSSSSYKDYVVVVTGPNSGPFTNQTDWATAASLWNPIVTNGGFIVGYVHTLQSPTNDLFRPLASVEADITNWVGSYGHLGGIFLDEYYPRFEIAGPSGSYATFPNGTNQAPTNLNFINSDGSFNGNQVDPTGGYYDQLTSWINCHYPALLVVANPGGHFYSNQTNYVNLVDVCCTFENSYSAAANSPVNDWSGLDVQFVTTNADQAALIYANSSDLDGAIDRAISHGYDLFYTTDRTPSGNVWGGLPPYFTSEVNYVANHR